MPSAVTWMDPETVILGEVSLQRKTSITSTVCEILPLNQTAPTATVWVLVYAIQACSAGTYDVDGAPGLQKMGERVKSHQGAGKKEA